MKLYCPRCDVEFEKDLARCPGCGWDFRAHVIPQGFLDPPLDFSPLKEFGKFVASNLSIIFLNGILVQVVGFFLAWIIFRITTSILRILMPHEALNPLIWITPLVSVFAFVLLFPIWAQFLYSLLRRYRYQVVIPLFSILPPRGNVYIQILSWAPWCFLLALILLFAMIVPGIIFLYIFVPFLILITLDKLNISARRKAFILLLTFKKLWLLFLMYGLVLTIIWILAGTAFLFHPAGLIIPILLLPLQSAVSMLLYESLLGRMDLDVE